MKEGLMTWRTSRRSGVRQQHGLSPHEVGVKNTNFHVTHTPKSAADNMIHHTRLKILFGYEFVLRFNPNLTSSNLQTSKGGPQKKLWQKGRTRDQTFIGVPVPHSTQCTGIVRYEFVLLFQSKPHAPLQNLKPLRGEKTKGLHPWPDLHGIT
jgi:hypothetical protein